MLKKLHIQMTIFCTLITGIIMVSMSVINILSSERSLRENAYISFQNDVSSILASLENQSIISHEWLTRMETNEQYLISLSNNGVPLLYDTLKYSEERSALLAKASRLALSEYGFHPSDLENKSVLTKQLSYVLHEKNKEQFYLSAANIPKQGYYLRIQVLYPLAPLHAQIARQRIQFFTLNFLGMILLFIFSYFFTRQMLLPIKKNQEQQIQFVASASHELRTPLTVILSSLSAMEKADEANQKRFQNMILSEGQRMSRLINDLLTLAQVEHTDFTLQLGAVELDTLLLDAAEKFEPLAEKKNIRLTVTLPDEVTAHCAGDAQRLAQVLAILLDNAISYTPTGGRIGLALYQHHNHLEIRVADSGPGIPDTCIKQIWNRFYRMDKSHSDRKHFGLGLPIAKEIIRSHRGNIWALNASEYVGAVFIITLPLFIPDSSCFYTTG